MPRSYIRWIHSNTPARCCPLMKFTGPSLSGISTERKVNWGCSPTCWDGRGVISVPLRGSMWWWSIFSLFPDQIHGSC